MNSKNIPPQIETLLRALRRRIRAYIFVESFAILLVHLGILFWISFAADRFFEPSVGVRSVAWVLVILCAVWDVWRTLIAPLVLRLDARALAVLLEKRFPQLKDSLLTIVALGDFPPLESGEAKDAENDADEVESWRAALLEETSAVLLQRLEGVSLRHVFRFRPLVWSAFGASLLVASIAIFAIQNPQLMEIWRNRLFGLSADAWPRRVFLELESFEEGKIKIARGSDLEIRVRAGYRLPTSVENGGSEKDAPEKNRELRAVYIRYTSPDGLRSRVVMVREGDAPDPKDNGFRFTHLFRGILNSFEFDVVAEDASIRHLQVEVTDAPALGNMVLDFEYPDYMSRAPQSVPAMGIASVPMGANVTLRAEANKPLKSATISIISREPHGGANEASGGNLPEDAAGGETLAGERTYEFIPDEKRPTYFEWRIPNLRLDSAISISLRDTDAIESMVPARITLACEEDALPVVAVQPYGIGNAVTPNARIPLKGRVSDDYGLSGIFFDYRIERLSAAMNESSDADASGTDFSGARPTLKPIWTFETNPTDVRLDATDASVLELEPIKLVPGDKIQISAAACDRCDLIPDANRFARSQGTTLDVVTPQRLRLLLEARELTLRQLFEAARLEMIDTRAMLQEIKTGGTLTDSTVEIDSETVQNIDSYRVERVIQNNRKNSHELNSIREGVENCCLQMLNNRIDTPEWLERLRDGIQIPLVDVHEKRTPELEQTLVALKKAIDAGETTEAATLHKKSLRQFDELIGILDGILEKMAQMQDYNEVVESLRAIIREEEEVYESVRKKHRQGLLELEE
ncbi:MAG: hypothetical protein Q4D38_09965 [Planctomycetia bacterium]|nr:hypothetical protein [Planctomycetia bacterium]